MLSHSKPSINSLANLLASIPFESVWYKSSGWFHDFISENFTVFDCCYVRFSHSMKIFVYIHLYPFYSPIRAWHRLASQALNDSTWIRRLPPRLPILIDGKSKSSAHWRITVSGTLASFAASATVMHILFIVTSFYKNYDLSNFHKILNSQNATDTPNEKEEISTAMNGK